MKKIKKGNFLFKIISKWAHLPPGSHETTCPSFGGSRYKIVVEALRPWAKREVTSNIALFEIMTDVPLDGANDTPRSQWGHLKRVDYILFITPLITFSLSRNKIDGMGGSKNASQLSGTRAVLWATLKPNLEFQ